jgi:anthranilate synthase component 1
MRLNDFPSLSRFRELAGAHNVVPVAREILADTETPVSLLRKLYDGAGPAFLFESVEGGERWGRYSFLGSNIRAAARVFSQRVEWEEGGRTESIDHGGDPLAVLRERTRLYRPASLPDLPMFWAGLVGYLGYEMVTFFEPVHYDLTPDRCLAHFVLPGEMWIFDNVRHVLTIIILVFLDGAADAEGCFWAARRRLDALEELAGRPASPTARRSGPPAGPLEPVLPPEAYRAMVTTVKDHIRAGDIIQAVVSQPFAGPAPDDLWALYRAMRHVNPSPYLFFLHLDSLALVGSSPETMVRLAHGVATLRPIAGTRPRGAGEQEDRALADELLRDEKERAEHLMLVDLGRNDLGRVAATGTVQVTDLMVVERYSHVMHLVSNIRADLKPGCDAWDLLRASFPAGTLTGAPKVRAMEIIAALEGVPRGVYGGAVGYLSFHGGMDLAITIRTACAENGILTVRAGAGIVADSDPESERLETVHKARALQEALRLLSPADGVETEVTPCCS